MLTLNKRFHTKKDKAAYVNECEKEFAKRLNDACNEIKNRHTGRIILLGGPSCSGKTTAAKQLISVLDDKGMDVHMISIDDFFNERNIEDRENELANGAKFDYDSIAALDFELFCTCAMEIISGRPTRLPHYDFNTGKRTMGEPIEVSTNSVFIFEGIQATYPELRELLGRDCLSVFVSVAQDIEMNGVYFNRRDIRLLRRLVRDYNYRSASPEFTLYLWRGVVLNEERSIVKYEGESDITIDTSLPYELFLLRDEALRLVRMIPETSKMYPKALEIEEKLVKLDSIPLDLVPQNSLMMEFAGQPRRA